MSFTLSDLQALLDSRLADLKDSINSTMEGFDKRLGRVEEHVRSAAGDQKVIELLEKRVDALELLTKDAGATQNILRWVASTGGAVILVSLVSGLL